MVLNMDVNRNVDASENGNVDASKNGKNLDACIRKSNTNGDRDAYVTRKGKCRCDCERKC